ncbi:sigma-70 family RNA polymerase sigma factor [Trujillonella humicola]|uniref:sigma-70 family RNA polymerase sigma factor n=1 Tax=Trujillonella humicola TaxID=3383699 RepID=UPI00390653DC
MGARGRDTQEESLRALCDAHASALLGYALRLCGGDHASAEDLVQETLVRAWRHLGRLDEQAAPVRPWLYTVAHHLAIDAHRARHARPHEVGDDAMAAIPSLDQLDGALDRIILVDALSSLSRDHRTVLVETYYRGRSVGEVAVVLGVPPGTVKSRCYYALRALKLALAERGMAA